MHARSRKSNLKLSSDTDFSFVSDQSSQGRKKVGKKQKIENKNNDNNNNKNRGANRDEPSPGLLFIGRRLNVPVVSILQ